MRSLTFLLIAFTLSSASRAQDDVSAADPAAAVDAAPSAAPSDPYQRVVEAPGFTKQQIFTASKIWIAENFKSGKAVLEYENSDEGRIIGNGSIKYPCSGFFDCTGKSNWTVDFTMRIEAKDGKFRTTYSNLFLQLPAVTGPGGFYVGSQKDVPVKGDDIAKVAARLSKFSDEILVAIQSNKASSDW